MAVSIASITQIALLILTILVLILLILISKQRKRINSLVSGKNASSLEDSIVNTIERVDHAEKNIMAHKDALSVLDSRVRKSIRGYSLFRYNAYEGGGGEQSFASGLIDEYGDGYVLSVIANRNHVGVYAKKVVKGEPESQLTEEESKALVEAKKSL